jgi:hypothetical protein
LLKDLWSAYNHRASTTGNLTASETKDFTALVEATLQKGVNVRPLFPAQHVERRVVKLEAQKGHYHASPILNPADENSAVDIYFQVRLFADSAPSTFCARINDFVSVCALSSKSFLCLK